MKYLISLLFLFSSVTEARQIKIGIIDAGLSYTTPYLHICPDGMYDLSTKFSQVANVSEMKDDEIQHGTAVTYLIANNLKDVDYCVYIIKIYNDKDNTLVNTHLLSYLLAGTLGVDIINYSSSGQESNPSEKTVLNLLTKNIKFVTAAGNDNKNLDLSCKAFPCCYDNIICVGNLTQFGTRHELSNYGKRVNVWEVGTNIKTDNVLLSGTSMSAALYTAKLARKMYEESLNEKK